MVKRCHIEPDDGREKLHFFHIQTLFSDKVPQYFLALHQIIFPQNIARYRAPGSFHGESIVHNYVMIDGKIVIKLCKVVVHVSRLQETSHPGF